MKSGIFNHKFHYCDVISRNEEGVSLHQYALHVSPHYTIPQPVLHFLILVFISNMLHFFAVSLFLFFFSPKMSPFHYLHAFHIAAFPPSPCPILTSNTVAVMAVWRSSHRCFMLPYQLYYFIFASHEMLRYFIR